MDKNDNIYLRGNTNVKTANVTEHVDVNEYKKRVTEIIRCKNDPIYFANKYYTIIGDNGKQIIELYPKQEKLIKSFCDNDKTVVLASRQSGKTTGYCIFILWYTLFNQDKNVLICANKEVSSLEFISRIKLAYEFLPLWLKPGVIEDGWNKKSIKFSNGCKITGVATSSDSARGQSCDLLILDEFAFVPSNIADEFWQSVYPVISRRKNSKIIIVSTPNGAQGLFYEIYERAKLGIDKEGWQQFKIDWWEVPERDNEWKEKILAGLNNDKRKFDQEFGNVFHGSSYTLIPGDILKQYKEFGERKDKLKPIEEDIDPHGMYKLNIWHKPNKNKTYVIGADTGEGIGKDYSTALVFDITDTSKITQVASFADNIIGNIEFAYVLAKIGKKYGSACIAMENNGISKATVETLNVVFEYENIVSYGTNDASRIGIHSHNTIKFNACVWLKDLMKYNDINIIINDINLIYEMGWFERKVPSPQPIFKAVSGKNDDYMMAFIWAMYCIHSGIVENYYIVDKYFLTNQGIEIPHLIKTYNNGYYNDEFSSFNMLPAAEQDNYDMDRIDKMFRQLKTGEETINKDDDFELAMNKYYKDDQWVNL